MMSELSPQRSPHPQTNKSSSNRTLRKLSTNTLSLKVYMKPENKQIPLSAAATDRNDESADLIE